MSYDLMVFDQNVAPRDRASFLEWYDDFTQWAEPRDYASPESLTGNLPVFYNNFRLVFPPLNGPHAVALANIDDPNVTEYTIGDHGIYLSFNWSTKNIARRAVIELAFASEVGFFDVSETDGVIAHEVAQIEKLRAKP